MEVMLEYGKAAFEAYKKKMNGIAFNGKLIPEWDELGDAVQMGWVAAAQGAVTIYLRECAKFLEVYDWTKVPTTIPVDISEDGLDGRP